MMSSYGALCEVLKSCTQNLFWADFSAEYISNVLPQFIRSCLSGKTCSLSPGLPNSTLVYCHGTFGDRSPYLAQADQYANTDHHYADVDPR